MDKKRKTKLYALDSEMMKTAIVPLITLVPIIIIGTLSLYKSVNVTSIKAKEVVNTIKKYEMAGNNCLSMDKPGEKVIASGKEVLLYLQFVDANKSYYFVADKYVTKEGEPFIMLENAVKEVNNSGISTWEAPFGYTLKGNKAEKVVDPISYKELNSYELIEEISNDQQKSVDFVDTYHSSLKLRLKK
ncbi:MAG: hypothetical protein RSA10_03005 [Bacilli bacterium]